MRPETSASRAASWSAARFRSHSRRLIGSRGLFLGHPPPRPTLPSFRICPPCRRCSTFRITLGGTETHQSPSLLTHFLAWTLRSVCQRADPSTLVKLAGRRSVSVTPSSWCVLQALLTADREMHVSP